MQLLSLNFFITSIAGIWRPVKWSSSCAKLLYSAFSFGAIVPMYFLMITQFMDIALVVDNVDDFTSNSLMFITIVTVCCKATTALVHRETIIDLVQTLLQDPCKPQDADEAAIQAKFNEFIRSCSIQYSILVTGSVTGLAVKSVLNIMHGTLPFRVWLPYNSSLSLPFWITSIHQMISLIFSAIINIGADTLIFGLVLQTCAQIEIFERRLHKYAKRVNSVFNQVFFLQFFGSIVVLCTSVYYLSSHITESESATLIIYTIRMFIQIYMYCWSGNEVILKSVNIGDVVYYTDWFLLTVSEKKDLLMIMKRSTIPIKFTSSFLITLSLQSYGNILKTSYSAFNVLQQS